MYIKYDYEWHFTSMTAVVEGVGLILEIKGTTRSMKTTMSMLFFFKNMHLYISYYYEKSPSTLETWPECLYYFTINTVTMKMTVYLVLLIEN